MLSTRADSGRGILDVLVWISPNKVSSLGFWNPAWVRVSGCCLPERRGWNFSKRDKSLAAKKTARS